MLGNLMHHYSYPHLSFFYIHVWHTVPICQQHIFSIYLSLTFIYFLIHHLLPYQCKCSSTILWIALPAPTSSSEKFLSGSMLNVLFTNWIQNSESAISCPLYSIQVNLPLELLLVTLSFSFLKWKFQFDECQSISRHLKPSLKQIKSCLNFVNTWQHISGWRFIDENY